MLSGPPQLSQRFLQFADEVRGSSPLYERLSTAMAADGELLGLCAAARPGQPVPNLLFAAIHYLLLTGQRHPLARFYPTVMHDLAGRAHNDEEDTPAHPGDTDPYPDFRAFCLEHRSEIEALVATRLVQTNEVRRSACLLPAFATVAQLSGNLPLALIEIGPSAGLNLLWDRYGFEYRCERAVHYHCGAPSSPVQITCNLKGGQFPPLPGSLPDIGFRAGIDLNPIDVRDDGAVAWLRALIWPEHVKRMALLESALQIARAATPPLLAGDAVDVLPEVIATVPERMALCVFHSHVINQFSTEHRHRLAELFAVTARQRALWVVAMGYHAGEPDSRIDLTTFAQGVPAERTLARCSGHGRWLEWLPAPVQHC